MYYKIRNKNNHELYLTGTPTYFSYQHNGRIFQSLGQLRTFLTHVMKSSSNSIMNDWEIIELDLVVKNTKEIHEIVSSKKILELLSI